MSLFDRLAALLRRPAPKHAAASSPLLDCVDPAQLAAPSTLVRLGTQYGGWLLPADLALDAASI